MNTRFFFLLCLAPVLVAPSCGPRTCAVAEQKVADRQYYARKAYREQQANREQLFDAAIIDEPTPDDLVLLIEKDSNAQWKRLPHETIEQWLARIYRALVKNHEFILELEQSLEGLSREESEKITLLQESVRKNEKLRVMLEQYEAPLEEPELASGLSALAESSADVAQPPATPEFMIHLVKKGETLYSIARYYYGDGEMAKDILLWNQGWIRSPYELLAGTGIILFPKDARYKKQQVVDAYLQKLEAQENG